MPDKWWHQLAGVLPWASRDGPTPGQLLRDFAALSGDLRSAQAELYRLAASGSDTSAADAQMRSDGARRSMDAHSPWAQAVMESQITSVLKQEGLGSFLGTVFPPVDVVFTDAPLVLVASPRDRILRQHSSLLDNRMTVAEMESLEDRLLQEQNLASLVLQTGGLASYPSMVNASGDLYHLTSTSVHEWLHQYWFFHPLGRNYFANPTMTTLNETAADLAGDELGATAYEAITGQPGSRAGAHGVRRAPRPPGSLQFQPGDAHNPSGGGPSAGRESHRGCRSLHGGAKASLRSERLQSTKTEPSLLRLSRLLRFQPSFCQPRFRGRWNGSGPMPHQLGTSCGPCLNSVPTRNSKHMLPIFRQCRWCPMPVYVLPDE